ncbi:hypothetical protein LSUE1_G001396 [Lachnellula suecica]|uniref:Uncharacterized protein n=1 Tax=Lachnellula suecica TaxID=602035 RepID=A0A8T9CBD8_9HELO|nr:hypothetical protein LSUE1_G001396 [Lachnellula suecica]
MATSHKRTSSAAGNGTSELPKTKKQTQNTPGSAATSTALQKVYGVQVDNLPMYSDPESGIDKIYSTLEDANNAVRAYVAETYEHAQDPKHGTKADGTVWWSSDDVGEGDGARVFVEIWDVQKPGSVPQQDWADGNLDSSDEQEF